jgi:hypothetical protein
LTGTEEEFGQFKNPATKKPDGIQKLAGLSTS